MSLRSPFQLDIPATDILSLVYPPRSRPSDQPVWIDAEQTSHSLSPAQALQWIKRLGAGLDALHVGQDEVVMMYSSNHIFVPVVYLGVAGSGRVFSGCNPAYGVNETSFQIENTGAKIILVEPVYLSTVLEAAAKSGFPKERIYLFTDKRCTTTDGVLDWSSFLPALSDARVRSWSWHRMSPRESRTRTAVLNYSSGTTGLPKGVMISHQNIIANVCQSLYMRSLSSSTPTPSPSFSPATSTSSERWLGFLPLYHAYGQLWSITAAALTLTPTFYMRSFSLVPFLTHIQTHSITHIQTAPPVLVMLAKRPETAKYDLSSLTNILCGAAPLSKELQNEVSDRFGLKVVQTWGMTEVTCSSLHVPGLLDDRSGSVGHIDPNCEMKLITDDGRVARQGERGEIHVKGPNVCLGYWRNEKATRETFDEEGFLRTGDVAIVDEKGWFWIVDRKKELIKVKGFQVAPAELEAVLLENEDVADAAVVGMLSEDGHEERPRAYVVLKDGRKDEVREGVVRDWMDKRVAKHKRLEGGVKFVDEVPKSPSGKIQRKVMRDWAERDRKELYGGIKAKL
ncbi:4-coumarate--CoA ligase-like 7 [Sphaceloma murrayae]|uniref:4-coumarate--CoA ligase-like 7 n=1 Tax=Sphaceloma murrayae TaxID=2082308 RepID=A0A2K1R1L9_9PEZI|nr:4-coumarate--CoA ligase-like 7 [Sphaceloma murrayae]